MRRRASRAGSACRASAARWSSTRTGEVRSSPSAARAHRNASGRPSSVVAGLIAAGRPRRAAARIPAWPGPSGSGMSTQAASSTRPPSTSGPTRPASRAASPAPTTTTAARAGSVQSASKAARRRTAAGAVASVSSSSSRRWRRALPLARSEQLGLRVALDRLGRELVDVGEDALCQQVHRLRGHARRRAGRGQPPPGHPRAHPVGGQQRVETAALAPLAAPQRAVDLGLALGRGVAHLPQELAQRLVDPCPQPAAERALQRAGVGWDLGRDGGHDLVGEAGQLGLQHRGQRGRKIYHRHDKFSLQDRDISREV